MPKRLLPAVLAALVAASVLSVSPARATPLPKGSRLLGVDPNQAQTETNTNALNDIQAQGIEVVSLHLQWSRMESSPGVFTGPDAVTFQNAVAAYAPRGLKLQLQLAPIDGCNRTVPSDLATTAWTSTTMQTRFHYLLNWVYLTAMQASPYQQIAVLSIGNEVDNRLSMVDTDLDSYVNYKSFFDDARAYARSETYWSTLPVGVTTQFAKMAYAPTKAYIQWLNANADHVLFTYYPLNGDLTVKHPYNAPVADIYDAVAAYPSRTLDIAEAGYPTSATLGSSESAQQTFVSTMFGIWDAYYPAINLIRFTWRTDWPPNLAEQYATTAGGCGGATGSVPAAPGQPTVTPTGGTGTTSWTYYIVAVNSVGESLPGATRTITNGVATLTTSAYNAISWPVVTGATSYKVIRSAVGAGGSPSSTGFLATVSTTSYQDKATQAQAYSNFTLNLKEYIATLGMRNYSGTGSSKLGWTQLGTEAHARGW
jgi:hypothetical protein